MNEPEKTMPTVIYTTIKEILEKNLEKRIAEGYSLVQGSWGEHWNKTCCPLNAQDPSLTSANDVSKLLGVSRKWVESFLNVYDEVGSGSIKEASELGKYFLNKYKPNPHWCYENIDC